MEAMTQSVKLEKLRQARMLLVEVELTFKPLSDEQIKIDEIDKAIYELSKKVRAS